MLSGATATKFGWFPVAHLFRAERMHVYQGEQLREVDFEPPVPVLDQEDLFAQAIDTATLIPGAKKVNALGSCTGNAGTASVAQQVKAATGTLPPGITGDPVRDEEYAIVLYSRSTMLTGVASQEFPPVDCGSNGLHVGDVLEREGVLSGLKTAGDIHGVVSLMQEGTIATGGPWFNSWMEPDSNGFVDGDGSFEAFLEAVRSGVAGGHERCVSAVERLVFNAVGMIDPDKSWVRERNSWSASWADNGSHRLHLSTYQFLSQYQDFKQFVPKVA